MLGVVVACSLGDASSRVQQPGPAMQAAQDYWREFATKKKYRMVTTRDERVLLLYPEERARADHALDLVQRSLARTDEILPPDPGEMSTGSSGPALSPDPEPSDDGTNPATPTEPKKEPKKWVWGAADRALDRDTIVFGLFRKPADYAEALTQLGTTHTYLASWIEKGKQDPGCILERPLFGACVDNVAGMQEWNPDNEIVHRTAQLAMRRRFGQQPVWVGLGTGWTVEFDLLNTIYCYPWRTGFVSAKEHGGWEAQLKRTFEKRGKAQPLTMEELAAIKRGGFSLDDAAISWGMARFLAAWDPYSFSKLLLDLHEMRERLGRKPTPDGKGWTMAADFELSAADQLGALKKDVSADALDQASEYFRLGRKWQRSPTAKGGG
jgi:hypothetical protein